MDTLKEKLKANIQPFIIIQQNDNQIFGNLIVDNNTIILGQVTFHRAFEILFKTFYIFNLKYEKAFAKLFQFFEYFVYKINVGRPAASVLKFENYISN